MKKLRITDYELYLTKSVMEAIDNTKKVGRAKVYVHKKLDAVRVLAMLDELQWDYPETLFIEVELCRIH